MTKTEFSAQERIRFYQSRFRNASTNQLAKHFNSLENSRGWTAERSYYTAALINEFQQRGIDISDIYGNENGQPVIHHTHVTYDKDQHKLKHTSHT